MKKEKELKPVSKESMFIVFGLMTILISFIAFLMPIPERTRQLIIVVLKLFGVVGFWVFFLGIFIFGIYLVFQKKLVKVKFNISLIGIFLCILAFLMLITYVFTPESRSFNYENVNPAIESILSDANLFGYDITTSGGLLGFYFVATLNYLSFPGGLVAASLIFLGGLAIIFRHPIKKLFVFINKKRLENKSKKEYYLQIEQDNLPKDSHSAFIGGNQKDFETTGDFSMPRLASDEQSSPFTSVTLNEDGLRRPVFGSRDEKVEKKTPPPIKPEVKLIIEEAKEEPIVIEDVEIKEEDDVKVITLEEEIPQVKVKEEIKIKEEVKPEVYIRPSFVFPSLNLLKYHESADIIIKNEANTATRVEEINGIFDDLRIGARAVGYTIGPSVTRFDIQMDRDTSVNTIARFIDDLSSRLGGVRARFEPVIKGKSTSGLEIQNEFRSNVGLKESLEKMPTGGKLSRNIPLGKNISGELLFVNIEDLPHMLIAGVTGSGKSVFVHSVIMSLIMRNHPDDLKLMIIDPKLVELNFYQDIPHLLCPIITDMSQAKVAFDKLVDEMESRYHLFQENRVNKISQYNELMVKEKKRPMPYIIVVVDEFADLNDAVRDLHEPVIRIAQKARASGIHLFISTQRPTADAIKPRIKSNLPSKIALMVNTFVDSTTILGKAGAERLLGNGDLLVDIPVISRDSNPRLQGCYVDINEIEAVTDYLREQMAVDYHHDFLNLDEDFDDFGTLGEEGISLTSSKELAEGELFIQVAADSIDRGYMSISFIQRTYGVGFPRAGRIFARLQKEGIVALEASNQKGCKVLITHVSEIPGYQG